MCTENSADPAASIGETNATATTARPAANAAISATPIAARPPGDRRRRAAVRAYTSATPHSASRTPGSNVQACHTSAGFTTFSSGWADNAAAASITHVRTTAPLMTHRQVEAAPLKAGIEQHPWNRVANHRQREQGAQHQAEDGHEPAPVDRPGPIVDPIGRRLLQRVP